VNPEAGRGTLHEVAVAIHGLPDRQTGDFTMKAITMLVLLVSLAAGEVLAQVNALPPTRHILVYGDAQARAIPDRFKIGIQFESVDMNPDVARRAVETNVRDILAKLQAVGVPEREIVATSVQIGARQRYDQKLQDQVFVGTAVNRSLTARFSRQSDLENFLAGVHTSQSLRISDVTTELSSEPELRKALREKTIISSSEKAEVIAKAYGAKLAGLYSVSDVAPQFEYGIREGAWPEGYEWSSGSRTLDRIEVTGGRVAAPAAADVGANVFLQTGYVTFQDKIYTVFLLAD
jgi:uncharacterized protein YggE